MDKFVINGGTPLKGQIETSGAKNSALPVMAASLLTDEQVSLDRIPRVRDIRTMHRLLVDIGVKADVMGECMKLTAQRITSAGRMFGWVKGCSLIDRYAAAAARNSP